jgi:nucleoside-triphosphatase
MGQAFLLTGRPGVGKTTVIRAVVDQLGQQAGGFYTEEIREGGKRTGFRLIALDGPRGILASVNRSSCYRVGKYSVHLDDLERVGMAAIQRALEGPWVDVVVIDEIGKMELFSSAFRKVVQQALDGPKIVLATVMSRPQPWADAIKARSDVILVELDQSNRQAMPDRIFRWLHGVQERGHAA